MSPGRTTNYPQSSALGHAERIDGRDAQQGRRVDDRAQVCDGDPPLLWIGRERVRVVAQRRDGDTCTLNQGVRLLGGGRIEAGDVDVGDAGVTALGPPARPAHHLHAVEALLGGDLKNVIEGEFREDSANESKLHNLLLSRRAHVDGG
jgi:hypothetical protein